MSSRLILCGLLSLVLVFGCATSSTPQQPQSAVYFTVLHTNDHHGRFWRNSKGEYGMAARKTLIDRIRAEVTAQGGQVLLLSGGDINTGVPESDLQHAEPDFKGMRLLAYDAMALGNHEFDNALDVLAQQQKWAGFPMLSANIYDRGTNQRYFSPYTIIEKGGLTFAIIGFTTEDTAKIGNPEFISSLEFRSAAEEAKTLLAQIHQQHAPDVTIAVTHMGHYDDAKPGVNAPGDVTLARAQVPGSLDMIIGGHSQEPVCMEGTNKNRTDYHPSEPCSPDQQNGTWIMQAHEWGKYVGRADYRFEAGQLELLNYQLIPVNLVGQSSAQARFEEDPIMLELLSPYQQVGEQKLSQKVAVLSGRLNGDRNQVRFRQTNLGRLIAAAQMEKTRADLGLISGGGVRDSIEPGVVTYKDVLRVQPFSNTVAYVEMTGQELLEYLAQVATKPTDSGAYAQFFGIRFTLNQGQLENVIIGDKPIDNARTYRLSLASFYASGGDGYPKLLDHPGYVDTGFVDADVLRAYLQHHSPINANDYAPKGEITIINQ